MCRADGRQMRDNPAGRLSGFLVRPSVVQPLCGTDRIRHDVLQREWPASRTTAASLVKPNVVRIAPCSTRAPCRFSYHLDGHWSPLLRGSCHELLREDDGMVHDLARSAPSLPYLLNVVALTHFFKMFPPKLRFAIRGLRFSMRFGLRFRQAGSRGDACLTHGRGRVGLYATSCCLRCFYILCVCIELNFVWVPATLFEVEISRNNLF